MGQRAARYSRKRIEILRSAAAAFRRRGYHGASVEEIARALHMTKGNLYYYFRNKEEILYDLHDYSLDILLGHLEAVVASDGLADSKLRRLVEGFVHMIIDELHGTALTMDLQALSPPRLRKVIAKRDRFDRGIRRVIEEGVEAGVFAPGEPKLLAFAILGAVNWITRWYDPRGPASSERIGRAFSDLLLDGLRSRSRGPADHNGKPERHRGTERGSHNHAKGQRSHRTHRDQRAGKPKRSETHRGHRDRRAGSGDRGAESGRGTRD
jgi:AcrR family transcriptional regulator